MYIGIDVSSIPYGTGVSNYTLNLVKNLLKIDKTNHYKIFFSSLRQPLPSEISLLRRYPNVSIYHYRLPPTLLELLWNRLRLFPIEFFIGKCDIFHTSDWTQPPALKAKLITTVHDLVPFLYPELQHPKTNAVIHRKMSLSVKNCTSIICVSQNTKDDLLRLFPKVNPSKIHVIYEAAEEKYENFLKLGKDIQNKKKKSIETLYDLKSYFLAQGTKEPRKNLQSLIEAFLIFKNKYPRSHFQLAIAGKYGWGENISRPKIASIKILGYIPEKDMVALHAASLCLIYPSLYEGFGLPLVKAMKLGVPVITSNTSSMPEVVADAAILVDPNSVENITKAIENIATSSSLRRSLSKKGLKRSTIFSWHQTAKETLNLYNQIC